MIFRPTGRATARQDELRAGRDEILAAADRTFGRHPDDVDDLEVTLDGYLYVYDPAGDPPFVLRPDCDRCGTHDLDQFPLEDWVVDGASIRAQSRTLCRDCRFHEITTAAVKPRVTTTIAPQRRRRRTRRYGQQRHRSG